MTEQQTDAATLREQVIQALDVALASDEQWDSGVGGLAVGASARLADAVLALVAPTSAPVAHDADVRADQRRIDAKRLDELTELNGHVLGPIMREVLHHAARAIENGAAS
jgi:hypothetical protein